MITSNIKEITAKFEKRMRVFDQALTLGLRDGLREFERERMIHAQLTGRKSPHYGLNSQTGNARSSTDVILSTTPTDIVGVIQIASRAWYLKVHQHYKFEGYIRPKNASLLAVPIHPAARGKSPKDFAGELVFIKPAGKPPILIRQVRRGGAAKAAGAVRQVVREDVMFALKPYVYIPKRLYFYEEFGTYGKRMIEENVMKRIREAANAN